MHPELFQVRQDSGTRASLHAKPYIFAPDTQLTVSLSPQPDLQDSHGAIGTVTEARLRGLRPQDIGHAQAWYYPQDRVIVLWECFLQPHYRDGDDPAMDTLHTALWQGFEGSLRRRFAQAQRIMTTWEDSYARPAWQRFLEKHGYRQGALASFVKAAPPVTGRAA